MIPRNLIFCALLACSAALAERAPSAWKTAPASRIEVDGRTIEVRFVNGVALTEGDIQIATERELSSAKRMGRSASYLPWKEFRWPKGIIPFTVDREFSRRARIDEAVREWNEKTPIKLVPRTDEANYVLFKPVDDGCYAAVGMRGGEQTVNLDEDCETGAVIHEIGHAVGLWHTQSRGDRGRYIQMLYENIDKRERLQWDQRIVDGADMGGYDYSSVMHYSRTAFQSNAMPVFQTVPPGIPVGLRNTLSAGDIDAVRRLYGEKPEAVTISSNPPGLEVMVDGERTQTPTQFAWTAGETHTISAPERAPGANANEVYRWGRWSDGGAISHEITVSRDTTVYTAEYSRMLRVRTDVAPAEAGAVKIVPESKDGFYPLGSRIRLIAEPAEGYKFLSWTAGEGGSTYQTVNGLGVSANPSELWVSANNMFYVATFTQSPMTTITSTPPGQLVLVDDWPIVTPRNYAWSAGSKHTIELEPEQLGPQETVRYVFDAWTDGSKDRKRTAEASEADQVINSIFRTQYSVATDLDYLVYVAQGWPSEEDVGLQPASDRGFYDAGTTVTLSIRNNDYAKLSNWYSDVTGTSLSTKFTVNEQKFIVANFVSPRLASAAGHVNDASGQPGPIAPGMLLRIHGNDLGPAQETEGGGAAVWFGDDTGRVLNASRDQVRVVVPASVLGKRSVQVVVEGPGGKRVPRTLGVAEASPGIYTRDRSGLGEVVSSGALLPGTDTQILICGAGLLDAAGRPTSPVTARIGGREATVVSAGPAGSRQPEVTAIVLRIPADLDRGQTLPISVTVGGVTSAPGPVLTISR